MEEDEYGFAHREFDERKHESRMAEIKETLHKVDRILAEFYEIHRPHINEPEDHP
jgi:hypothetical protein